MHVINRHSTAYVFNDYLDYLIVMPTNSVIFTGLPVV